MSKLSDYKIYTMLVISAICWGGAFVAAKFVVMELHPTVAAALRFTLAFLVLLVFLIAKEGKKAWVHPKEWLLLWGAALTGVAFYNILFFTGLIYTSPVNGSLLVATGPVITTIISALFLKETINNKQIAGLILSIIGVVIIISKGSFGALFSLNFNHGDLLMATAVFGWSLYTIIGKATAKRWSSLLTTTYACGLGALILWVSALPQLSQVRWQEISLVTIGALAFLAIFASAIGFVFWYEGIGSIGPSRAAIFQNLVPAFSAIFSYFLLQEGLMLFHWFGAAMILYGVYLANKKGKSPLPVASLLSDRL
ncbi:MAG: DMT family transporter [Bacillota bacterium]